MPKEISPRGDIKLLSSLWDVVGRRGVRWQYPQPQSRCRIASREAKSWRQVMWPINRSIVDRSMDGSLNGWIMHRVDRWNAWIDRSIDRLIDRTKSAPALGERIEGAPELTTMTTTMTTTTTIGITVTTAKRCLTRKCKEKIFGLNVRSAHFAAITAAAVTALRQCWQ